MGSSCCSAAKCLPHAATAALLLVSAVLAASLYLNAEMAKRLDGVEAWLDNLAAAKHVSVGCDILAHAFAEKSVETGSKSFDVARILAEQMSGMAQELGTAMALLGTGVDYYRVDRRQRLAVLAERLVASAEALEAHSSDLAGDDAEIVPARVAQLARELKNKVTELIANE